MSYAALETAIETAWEARDTITTSTGGPRDEPGAHRAARGVLEAEEAGQA